MNYKLYAILDNEENDCPEELKILLSDAAKNLSLKEREYE